MTPGVAIRPVVSWPRAVAPGGSYVISVDLTLVDHHAPWPYEEEEFIVGCMLDGRPFCTVRALDDAGVVLHRFGGTYGPARFVAEVTRELPDLAGAALWLTLTTSGGVPFYTGRLPLDGTAIPHIDEMPPPAGGGPSTREERDVTLVIRIDEPSAPDQPPPVRGFRLNTAESIYGTIPWPLPPIRVDGQEFDAVPWLLDAAGPSPAVAGRYLWDLFAAGPVGPWWEDATAAASGPVRTLLEIGPADLRQLPWELMLRPDGERVFLSSELPWARGTGDTDQHNVSGLRPPIRLLVVLSERAVSTWYDDLSAIYGALRDFPGQWEVEALVAPTAAGLQDVLLRTRPHVLHVVADATTDTSGPPSIEMPADNGTWLMTTDRLANLVDFAPRLVLLDTRHGTGAAFAEALLARGCGAVIIMHGALPPSASAAFCSGFYREVAAGRSIDAAVARGRLELFTRYPDESAWAAPSLYLQARPDRVVPAALAAEPQLLRQEPYARLYRKVSQYVDRTREQRAILRAVDPDDGGRAEPLVLISGEQGVGTTAVAESVLAVCRLRGLEVTYVSFDNPGRTLSWLTALRQIRDALVEWVPGPAAEPVARFDHELAYLKERFEPPLYTDDAKRADDGGEFDAGAEDYPRWIDRILAAFRQLLAAIARERPLVLALDHVDRIGELDLGDVLAPGLLAPAGRGELEGVRLLVVHDSRGRFSPTAPRFDISRWPASQVEALGAEYYARQGGKPVSAETRQLLQALGESLPEGMTAGQFRLVLDLVDRTRAP